jgi:hypothetical protein
MLRRYDQQPLPDWPHGITLNTAVAFISTLCRMAFLVPVVESLAQLKWNWFRSPRPLHDFKVFDEATRGPLGSLKLVVRTRARYALPSKLTLRSVLTEKLPEVWESSQQSSWSPASQPRR